MYIIISYGCTYFASKLLLTYSLDPSNEMNALILVVYKFDGVKDHPVLVRPHGNAKRSDHM